MARSYVDAGWLTRAQAASRLGISKTRLRQLERRGDLHPVQDEAGRWRFDPEEVRTLAAHRSASGPAMSRATALAIAAEMFRDRRTVLEIRIATGLSTEALTRLYAEYCTPMDLHVEQTLMERETRAFREHERRLERLGRGSGVRWRDDDDR